MMGSGKTSVGQLLSKYLNSTFYDLDAGIEKRFNLTITEIFNTLINKDYSLEESYRILNQKIISTGISLSLVLIELTKILIKNIDMLDIGLFWQLTLKTIDDLRIVGNENLALEMYI